MVYSLLTFRSTFCFKPFFWCKQPESVRILLYKLLAGLSAILWCSFNGCICWCREHEQAIVPLYSFVLFCLVIDDKVKWKIELCDIFSLWCYSLEWTIQLNPTLYHIISIIIDSCVLLKFKPFTDYCWFTVYLLSWSFY